MRHLADRSGVAIPGTGRHTGSSARQRWATRVRRIEVTRCNPARQLTARTVAGLYRSPWTDLVPAGHRWVASLRGSISSSLMGSALGANRRLVRDPDPVRRPME